MKDERKGKFVFSPTGLLPAESARMVWRVFAPEGTTREDILRPEAWAHISRDFKILHQVEVQSETGEFFALLQVAYCGQNFAKMQVLNWVEFKEPIDRKKQEPTHEVRFINNRYKWGVVRLSDKEMLTKELETEEQANAWLANHLKALAA